MNSLQTPQCPSPRCALVLEEIALSGIVLLFLVLKSFGLNPNESDENIYFYNAWLMGQGFLPYRDFFFAHPPLHLIPGWLLLLVVREFNLTAFKLLPVFAALMTGLCVYLITRRFAGRIGAVVACLLFFFSHDLLRASSHWTGINWSVMWLTLGFFFVLKNKKIVGGILLGIAVCTGVYTAPAVFLICVMRFIARAGDGVRCAALMAVTLAVVNGVFLVIGGQAFIDGVYVFHTLKTPTDGSGLFDQLDKILFHNFFLMASPVYLLPFLLGWIKHGGWHQAESVSSGVKQKPRKADRAKTRAGWRVLFNPDAKENGAMVVGLWCFVVWLGTLFFLYLLTRVFHFYFLLLFPFAAVCGGVFAQVLTGSLWQAVRERRFRWGLLLGLLLLVAGYFVYPLFEHQMTYFKKEEGKTSTYSFPRSPLPHAIQRGMAFFFWEEGRVIGRRYSGIQYYLWHESRDFMTANEIAAALKTVKTSNETLFGDSTTTPLVALLSGAMITDHFVDTNVMRFKAGMPSARETIGQLERAMARSDNRFEWLLISPNKGIGGHLPFKNFFETRFSVFKTFTSPYFGTYLLMRRRSGSE
ncbi:MAG: hypothetical protein HQM16_17235 [Deltaproteobacteria bacterium]|nr:hypothetical protein [Deltaproteobacteria bacterium]